ncbi:hypothetical protein PAMP_010754 [Pampus punctatissimus]
MSCLCSAFRSTAELESFHNHILMYASKHFCFILQCMRPGRYWLGWTTTTISTDRPRELFMAVWTKCVCMSFGVSGLVELYEAAQREVEGCQLQLGRSSGRVFRVSMADRSIGIPPTLHQSCLSLSGRK